MLSLSATLVRRVVYMNPVPAVETSRAITTLSSEKEESKVETMLALPSQPLTKHGCDYERCTRKFAYRAFDLTAMTWE